jgi:hypothetical protein
MPSRLTGWGGGRTGAGGWETGVGRGIGAGGTLEQAQSPLNTSIDVSLDKGWLGPGEGREVVLGLDTFDLLEVLPGRSLGGSL